MAALRTGAGRSASRDARSRSAAVRRPDRARHAVSAVACATDAGRRNAARRVVATAPTAAVHKLAPWCHCAVVWKSIWTSVEEEGLVKGTDAVLVSAGPRHGASGTSSWSVRLP